MMADTRYNNGELRLLRHQYMSDNNISEIGMSTSEGAVWVGRIDFFVKDRSVCIVVGENFFRGCRMVLALTYHGIGWVHESKLREL